MSSKHRTCSHSASDCKFTNFFPSFHAHEHKMNYPIALTDSNRHNDGLALTPQCQFPRARNILNPRTSPVNGQIVEVTRGSNRYVATVPNAFHTVTFNIDGNLDFGHTLSIRDCLDAVLLSVSSLNVGFRIVDCRTGLGYLLTRNGSVNFLYEVSGSGEKCPVAMMRTGDQGFGSWSRNVDIIVPDGLNMIIGSVGRRRLTPWSFMTRCKLYNVETQPAYDVVMVIALQFCYEAMNKLL